MSHVPMVPIVIDIKIASSKDDLPHDLWRYRTTIWWYRVTGWFVRGKFNVWEKVYCFA